ncbi:MAG: PQQ-binding-like beta-propeller repeat protein [Myxococcales bacterium]|nr:PQQ-binding-like beta-propeller repeat protein [Myxococcales bacterium]
MAVTKISCPGCGANLSPTAGLRGQKCEYCGTAVSFDQPPPPKAKEPARVSVPQTSAKLDAAAASAKAAATASKAIGRVLVSVFFSIIVVGGGIVYAVFMILSKSGVDVSDALEAANVNIPVFSKDRSEIPGLGGLGGLGGFTLWDSVGGRPLALEVQGKPAFIGRIRQKPDDSLNFVAVDGATGEILYTVGPFASYSDGYRNTYVAVAGDRLAVSDHEAKLHLVDAGSGATVKTLELKDRVKTLCGAADGSTFWLEQVDKRHFLVDPQSGALSEGKRPGGCVATTDDEGLDRKERKELRRFDRKLDDFKATGLVEDGEWTIVAGYKSPGTAVPKAAGFDADGEVAWTIDVPAIDPLRARERSNQHDAAAKGRYFTIYGEGQKTWHVTAIDATSGDRIWDERLRTIFAVDKIDGLYATEDFVLVVRTSSLEILDPATGELRGTVGRETYED